MPAALPAPAQDSGTHRQRITVNDALQHTHILYATSVGLQKHCHCLTSAGGSWSTPSGVSSLTSIEIAVQRPRNSCGKTRSAGPPPMASQARSTAGGSRLAAAWIESDQAGDITDCCECLHGVSGRQQERAVEEYHPETRHRMWLHQMLPMHLTAFITCFKGGK